MLDEMTPEDFDERMAHDIVEPWGEPWEQAATIAASVVNSINQLLFARAGKTVPRQLHMETEDFIPRPTWYQNKRSQKRYLSNEETAQDLQRLV